MSARLARYIAFKSISVVLFLAQGAAQAQTYPAPVASAVFNGDYTVSYVPNCGSIPPGGTCYFTNLQEKVEPSGSWTTVSSGTGEIAFTSKPQGTYSYRMHAAGYAPGYGYMEVYSSTIGVVVAESVERDDIPTQMDYSYEVRQGYFDADSNLDLFVKKVSGGDPLNGVIEEIILQQGAPVGGVPTFSTVVPTSAQASSASAWPTSSAQPVLRDINVDGFVDVVVTDAASAVTNAPNQIVFAPGQLNVAQPLGLTAVDTSLIKFTENSLDYFVNPDYFSENAPVYFFQVWIWYAYCDLWGFPGIDSYYWDFFPSCYFDYIYLSGYFADFSGFDQGAMAIWSNEVHVDNETITQTEGVDAIEDAVEDAIGVSIGGWPMEEVLGTTGEHTDPDTRRGLETFWGIVRIAQANEDEVEPEEAPAQTHPSSCMQVRSRNVLGIGPLGRHASLHYLSGVPASVIGAYDSVADPAFDGVLFSVRDPALDHYLNTMLVSIVNPPAGQQCDFTILQAYWQVVLSAEGNYEDDLPYDKNGNPEDGYNSNGFVHGIVNATGGSVDDPPGLLDRLWGWDNPVPASNFQ